MPNKLTTYLLLLADNDDFQTSLHILLTKPPSQLNLNRRTSSGDYLITLSAYAACEKATNTQTRINALKCLIFVLDRDFTAVNKIAGDGGGALHCALAAAACFVETDHHDDDSDDDELVNGDQSFYSESEESSICDSEYDDDDDESVGVKDEEYLDELKTQAASDISITDNYYSEFANLSSENIILLTIKLLLSYEADVNLPLANILNVTEKSDNSGSECDDIELAYAREAVLQQWTPLMFALQMVILATKLKESMKNEVLSMSILIVKLLLEAGADATYMIANKSYGNWNALDILATSSHILTRIDIGPKEVELINRLNQTSSEAFTFIDQETNIINIEDIVEEGMTVYDCLHSSLASELKDRNIKLTALQQFTIAIMINDEKSALSVLEKTSRSEKIDEVHLLRKWRLVKYSTIFPLSTVWDDKVFKTKTLLNIAFFCNAWCSIRLLIGTDLSTLSEVEIRNSIQCAFMSYYDDACTNRNRDQISILSALLGLEDSDGTIHCSFSKKRQRVLDRLLIESCSKIAWAQNVTTSTLTLLTLGADPNITSIASEIVDGLSPLHLVAGNYRGTYGVEKVDYLLGKRKEIDFLEIPKAVKNCANLYAKTNGSNELALHLALKKKNFHVARRLFEAMDDNIEIDPLMKWDIEMASLLGEAAIGCASEELFESAVNIMTNLSFECKESNRRELSRSLGKLLLWAVDERSGFGSKRSLHGDEIRSLKLKKIVDAISEVQTKMCEISVSPWARDEISGHTPLHSILRNDRGSILRTTLLSPLCTIMLKDSSKVDLCTNFISLPCSGKFGLYTALHLACALGCEDSVKILLEYEADPRVLCGDSKKPVDLIPKGKVFSTEIMTQLQ